jgi:hypothetical protein
MCGELEEEVGPGDEAVTRYEAHVHSMLAGLKLKSKHADPIHAHLDRLFRGLLVDTVDERKAPRDMEPYQRLAMEPLVFARLAGFMAAHLPLSEDPLKRVIEAVMLGYSEGEIAVPDHSHDHFHGHDHGHGHSH